MKFTIKRKYLLKPLQQINSILSSQPIKPILGNLLLQATNNFLLLTSTDLEMEIIIRIVSFQLYKTGITTIPARKFLEICRNLPEEAEITMCLEKDRILMCSNRSRFLLSTLPAADFPCLKDWRSEIEFAVPQVIMKRLIEATQFSMAHQDVRYYLNGLLLETGDKKLRTVAADGHRLAIFTLSINATLPNRSVIIPRRGVTELMRILNSVSGLLRIQIGSNNIRVNINNLIFTSKLIDGCFPDYHSILPKNSDKILESKCDDLKQALTRVSILSNKKFHGIRLYIKKNQLKITSNNQIHEEAEEILDVSYSGIDMEICFNVKYILDVLNTLKCDSIRILLTDYMSSIQIEDISSQGAIYIIMPMRL